MYSMLLNLPQGDGGGQRIGNEVSYKSVSARWSVEWKPAYTEQQNLGYRVFIFKPKSKVTHAEAIAAVNAVYDATPYEALFVDPPYDSVNVLYDSGYKSLDRNFMISPQRYFNCGPMKVTFADDDDTQVDGYPFWYITYAKDSDLGIAAYLHLDVYNSFKDT